MIPISVCIITKNEADNLEKCLEALSPYPFEVIVVDTGSTDDSKDVARKYTDKVYDFEWINDFSAARNYAASRASHNMILPIDTDEFVTDLDWEELQTLIEKNPKGVGAIKRLDYFEANGEKHYQICMVDRIYNRKYYQYEKAIHEVLSPTTRAPYSSYPTSVTADHIGYLGTKEKLDEKAKRDMDLLLKEVEAAPDNPYNYFQIAQCYLLMRDHEHALDYFKMAMEHSPNPKDEYTRILVCNYGNILLDYGRVEEASSLLSYYEYFHDNTDYLCMIGLIYLHLNQPLKALPEYVKALTASHRDSIDPVTPSYYIGYIYELFGKNDIARTHYQNCKDFPPAVEALERLGKAQV